MNATGRRVRAGMSVPVRLLVALDLALSVLIALSPLIVAIAVKPDLTGQGMIDILVERAGPGVIASVGMIAMGLLAWARYGPTTIVCVALFFCPVLAALFFAAWGFQ
ncbi:MAG: hypothetical protein B7Z43_01585 [Sphingomonas sp. 12-62-6]|nr:MAG: hypothetical protein B7Z43_01585 [Sphingomonas sp. 12-62-6]